MLPALYTLSSLRFRLARNARAYTSARSIGFCVIWVCISSSSSSKHRRDVTHVATHPNIETYVNQPVTAVVWISTSHYQPKTP